MCWPRAIKPSLALNCVLAQGEHSVYLNLAGARVDHPNVCTATSCSANAASTLLCLPFASPSSPSNAANASPCSCAAASALLLPAHPQHPQANESYSVGKWDDFDDLDEYTAAPWFAQIKDCKDASVKVRTRGSPSHVLDGMCDVRFSVLVDVRFGMVVVIDMLRSCAVQPSVLVLHCTLPLQLQMLLLLLYLLLE